MEKVKFLIVGIFVGSLAFYLGQILDISTFAGGMIAIALVIVYLLSEIRIMEKIWRKNA